MQSTTGQRRRAIFEVLLSAAMWSTGGIFIKLLDWGAMPIAGVRSLIAGLVMAAYMLMRRIPYKLNARSARSAVALCGTFTLFVAANKLTTAANAIVLQFTAPIFVLLLTALVWRKLPRRGELVACGVGGSALSIPPWAMVLMGLIGLAVFLVAMRYGDKVEQAILQRMNKD